MKHLFCSFFIVGIWLMNVSCNKKDPCDDGSCCGASDQKMIYRFSIENARADVLGDALIIENVKGSPPICYQQRNFYEGKLKSTFIDGQPQPFKYRVWGKIYNCDNCPTIVQGDVFMIQIDKIEIAD
jgi:hypothetical protein